MPPLLYDYSPEDREALHRLADARAWDTGIGIILPSGLTLDADRAARLIKAVYADPYVDAATRDALVVA